MSKNIADIYTEYHIPPWLAEHMYRVAAVAATLFDARVSSGDTLTERTELITACLLHDMANIIKFNFDVLLLADPSERPHWEKIKADMIARYGLNEHVATLAIMDEIGNMPKAREVVSSVDFMISDLIEGSTDIYKKIFLYADSRVGPNGVVSLAGRFKDAHIRYKHLYDGKEKIVERQERALYSIECQLFEKLHMKPGDITDASIQTLQEKLKNFSVC